MTSLTLTLDDDGPSGLALIAGDGLTGGRVYVCDPANHQIDVLDDAAHALFSFGSYGTGPGQFDTPLDLAIVPEAGDQVFASAADAVLAVADHGNHRLQLFTLDGAWLATVDDSALAPQTGWPLRTGWPFFRLGLGACVRFPSRLRWRAPYLDVTSGVGGISRVDLQMVFLPDFDVWVKEAPLPELRRAFRLWSSGEGRRGVPDHCLHRIAHRLHLPERRTADSVVLH